MFPKIRGFNECQWIIKLIHIKLRSYLIVRKYLSSIGPNKNFSIANSHDFWQLTILKTIYECVPVFFFFFSCVFIHKKSVGTTNLIRDHTFVFAMIVTINVCTFVSFGMELPLIYIFLFFFSITINCNSPLFRLK